MSKPSEQAIKIAKVLDDKFEIVPFYVENAEPATIEELAALIEPLLAPAAAPWSTERPTQAGEMWWYAESKEDEPWLCWTFTNGRYLMVESEEGETFDLDELNGWWSGPLAAPPFRVQEDEK